MMRSLLVFCTCWVVLVLLGCARGDVKGDSLGVEAREIQQGIINQINEYQAAGKTVPEAWLRLLERAGKHAARCERAEMQFKLASSTVLTGGEGISTEGP